MVEAIFYVLRTAVSVAGLATLLRAVELGLHPVATLVHLGLVARNLGTALAPGQGPLAFYRRLARQAHQFGSNPAGGQAAQAIGRTKGGLNTKIAALVESRGRLMAVTIGPGQTDEVKTAAPLLKTLRRILLIGDKGFDRDALRQQMLAQGCLVCVPPRSNRNNPAWWSRVFYRQRHKIENCFQRIKIHKRISTRYDKLALTFLNFILLAAAFDWLKSF